MKKRITLKDWTYIGKCNHAAKWCRPICSYRLVKKDIDFIREQKMGWPWYIIVFIPVHILQAFACIWDGGLKEFTILGRDIGYDVLTRGSPAYTRAEEIWNKYNKSKSNS
jgi:hypothetical protein